MKKIYFKILIPLLLVGMSFYPYKSYSQCPGGQVPVSTAYKFKNIGIIPKNTTDTDPYRLKYTTKSEESCVYFFRIKHVYSNGYTRFSDIKSAELESSGHQNLIFTQILPMALLVSNLQIISTENYSSEFLICRDKTVANKEILVNVCSYYQITTLQKEV